MSYANRWRASLGRWESEFGRSRPVLLQVSEEIGETIKTLSFNKKHTHRANLPNYEVDIQELEQLQSELEVVLLNRTGE